MDSDQIEFFTFTDASMVAGPYDEATAENNRLQLQRAIAANAGQRIVVGLPGNYYIAQTAEGDTIPLVDNAIVWCLPGCRIIRKHDSFDSGKVGVVRAGSVNGNNPVSNARWIGGTFVGEAADGVFPEGEVFHIEGDDILIEDVTIEGYNGIGMMIAGDRVRVVNPTIRKPQPAVPGGRGDDDDTEGNGAGIRVKRGTGFRCYGGDVTSGGDAAIQFSANDDFASDVRGDLISDGLYQGVRCASADGRLILVGSSSSPIHDVRFVGITGAVTGGGECIRIQNNVGIRNGVRQKRRPNPISRVVLRDIAVSGGTVHATGFAIENKITAADILPGFSIDPSGDNVAVSDILVENLTVTGPRNAALKVEAALPPSYRPVRNLTWRGGGVFDPQATGDVPMLDIKALAGGLFAGLRIESGNAAVAIGVGDPSGMSAGDVPCSDIVFADVAITGVGAGNTGVRFDAAANCGFVRGRVAEAAGAQAVGIRMSTNSRRCFVEGTDLSGLTEANTVQLSPGTAPRVRDLPGSDLTVVPPLGTGPAEDVPMTSHAIDGRAGFLRVQTGTGTTEPVALTAIDGGRPGDLLVVARSSAVGSRPVKVRDVTGLALAGDRTLDTGDDLLTLVNVGTGSWAELARSDTSAP